MSPHWRCGNAPPDRPLSRPCPVHGPKRPLILADCTCGDESCDYCGGVAYRRDPFGGRPCCLSCFDLLIGGDE